MSTLPSHFHLSTKVLPSRKFCPGENSKFVSLNFLTAHPIVAKHHCRETFIQYCDSTGEERGWLHTTKEVTPTEAGDNDVPARGKERYRSSWQSPAGAYRVGIVCCIIFFADFRRFDRLHFIKADLCTSGEADFLKLWVRVRAFLREPFFSSASIETL